MGERWPRGKFWGRSLLFGAAPCETRYVEQQFGEAIDGKKEGRRQVPPCNLHPSRPRPSGCVMPGRVTPSSQSSTIFAAMLMEIEDAKRRPLQSQFGCCQEAEQVNGSRQAAAQALPASRLGLPTESANVITSGTRLWTCCNGELSSPPFPKHTLPTSPHQSSPTPTGFIATTLFTKSVSHFIAITPSS